MACGDSKGNADQEADLEDAGTRAPEDDADAGAPPPDAAEEGDDAGGADGGDGGTGGTGGTDGGSVVQTGTSFETAIDLVGPTTGSLDNDALERRYYRVQVANDGFFRADAALDGASGFDPAQLDLHLTVHDASHKLVARSYQPTGERSNAAELHTYLKAGTYFVTVDGCHYNDDVDRKCETLSDPNRKYTLSAGLVDFDAPNSFLEAPEGSLVPVVSWSSVDDTPVLTLYGRFDAIGDEDHFTIEIPGDGHVVPTFFVSPSGVDGNGSTLGVGRISLIASGDKTAASLGAQGSTAALPRIAPLVSSGSYRLRLTSPDESLAPAGGFYVVHVTLQPAYQREADLAENDFLPQIGGQPVGTYAVEGIFSSGTEKDRFEMTIPGASNRVRSRCVARSVGSSIANLQIGIVHPTNEVTQNPAEETDDGFDFTSVISGASVKIQVSHKNEKPVGDYAFYRCVFSVFQAP